jgi:hypothetical protein
MYDVRSATYARRCASDPVMLQTCIYPFDVLGWCNVLCYSASTPHQKDKRAIVSTLYSVRSNTPRTSYDLVSISCQQLLSATACSTPLTWTRKRWALLKIQAKCGLSATGVYCRGPAIRRPLRGFQAFCLSSCPCSHGPAGRPTNRLSPPVFITPQLRRHPQGSPMSGGTHVLF